MAKDGFNINVTGVGSAMGAASAGKIDTSGIQDALNKVASDLKKLDTTVFQRNLNELSFNIQKSATASLNFVENMQKAEEKLSSSLKQGLSPNVNPTQPGTAADKSNTTNSPLENQFSNSEKFTKSLSSLSDSVEKLAANIKKGGKEETTPIEKTEKPSDSSDFKKLIAAVGLYSIAKQLTENEIIAPNRAAGSLIGMNVAGNIQGGGNELISSFQERIANNTGTIGAGTGAALGGAIGSIIPGVGTLIGAGFGSLAGSNIGSAIGQSQKALELPTLQRSLQTDFYSNLSRQRPQLNQFAQSQYGANGFGSSAAFQDPYFESRVALGRSYARFAGGSLTSETTGSILKSLTAQGASNPQELTLTGNLLGQIARYTGKSSLDIERVYKAVEKSGLSPNEGLQKTLSLLQAGLTIKETEDVIKKTSQRTEAFSAGQQSYFGATPFQQFTAQQVGKAANFDVEKFYQGNPQQARELQELGRKANEELRSGRIGTASTRLQMLESIGITPGQGDIDKSARGEVGKGYITQSKTQEAILKTTQESIFKGAKGREPTQIIDETLSEIGKSTKSFSALGDATDSLISTFKDAASSINGYFEKLSHTDVHGNPISSRKPLVQTQGGR